MMDLRAGNRAWPTRIAEAASPLWTAFVGSVLLSLIAIGTSGTLNRDGMLYVDTARVFLQGGFSAAREAFAWPFLPILMAVVSQATGLGLENTGYLLNILFMAGACALLVACAARLFPEAVWPICLVLLATPGLNDYRNEVLREYGCWFFIMLAFWLALRWSEVPRWRSALAVHAALGAAALFRPEALAFFPALILWQLHESPTGERWRRVLMIGGLPLIGLGTLVALHVSGQLSSGRLAGDFGRLSLARFDAKAEAIAASLHEYAREQARTILFFGSLAIIPLKFAKMMGVFLVPLFFPCTTQQGLRVALARSKIFAWAFAAQLLVLMIFVTDMQFLAGRYVALLTLLAVPPTGYGLWLLIQRFPRWKIPVVLVTLLIMVGNVASLSPGKQQYVEAGAWLAQNASESPRIYIESARSAYYAGWRFAGRPEPKLRASLPEALAQGQYDLVVLEVSRKETEVAAWLERAGLREIKRFAHPNRDAVIIAEPVAGKDQDSAAKTARSRAKTGAIE